MRVKTFFIALIFFSLGFGLGYMFNNYYDFNITKNSTRGAASTGENFCNENIPSYQQVGCVKKELQKEEIKKETTSFEGKPCDKNTPMYSQPGCVK